MSEVYYGTHIQFVPGASEIKTAVWWVEAGGGVGVIGRVAWYSPWRKYCFFPAPETAYEQVCLREIAAFCESRTREYIKARKAAKEGG